MRWFPVYFVGRWTVEGVRRVRPSKSSPNGYQKTVVAPGGPWRSREAAVAEADRLNEIWRAKRRRWRGS